MSEKFTVMRFFGDHMILQSGQENCVRGRAPEGSSVELKISDSRGNESIFSAAACGSDVFELVIPPYPPSYESYTLTFSCGGEDIAFSDVLFGELYHISGQSNMELPICRTIDPLDPVIPKGSRFIREFRVPVMCCFGKNEEYDDFQGGEWKCAEGDDLMEMSAAGFYFAEKLSQKLGVPVGLVNTSAGGSPVEARMPYEMLMELGGYEDFLARCTVPDYEKNTAEADRVKYEKWCAELEKKDTVSGDIFTAPHEYSKCHIPFYFRDDPELSGFCGRVWFRKSFYIPDDMDMSEAVLILGAMIDADEVFVNGVSVGSTGYMYPPRIYPVPEGVLHRGENILHIRLEVRQGRGGFVEGKIYYLGSGDRLIDLSGEWEYAVAAKGEYLEPDVFFQGLPLSMYGALTAPAFNIKFKGLIWYQGESNDKEPDRYYELFKRFVQMYRERCGYDIPVIFTQLCNFDDPVKCVPELSWARLREQQRKCLDIPGTAMAVTIDIGESNDLHPINKRDVGRRLALCAERLIYKDEFVPEDIFPLSAIMEKCGEILLSFTDNRSVRMKNDTPKHFEIVSFDGKIIRPRAELSENGIILEYDGEDIPLLLRYAYENDPADPDLFSSTGLPLSPFVIHITGKASSKEYFIGDGIFVREFFPENMDNKCAVILSHGYNQSSENTSDIANSLAERGFRAYAFDFCGGGANSKSVGSGTDMSISSEIADLNAVIEYVKENAAPEKLFLYGESQGGFVSALTAAQRCDITGTMLLYPAFCIPEQWLRRDPSEMTEPFEFMGHVISRKYYDGVPRYDVFEKVGEYSAPVLIMHGTSDRVVNVSYAKKAAESFKNAELILYEGEDHGFSADARKKEFEDISEFLNKIILR
ncbi:MAG: alpha/beta fold hydrolase [Huintestinicola sp.]|uniref:alpha/beta fold hydrolase n=1 Tax=Huintestinicola sp. TaxID=2981661 RepID=UPI003F0E8652